MRTLELSGSIRREKRLQERWRGWERRGERGREGRELHPCMPRVRNAPWWALGGRDSLLRSREWLCLWHPLELAENYPLLLFWGCLEG